MPNTRINDALGHPYGGRGAEKYFSLENIKSTARNTALVEAARKFDPIKDNFYIFGPTGSGKTHFATAIMKEHGGRVIKPYQLFRAARIAATEDEITDGDITGLFLGNKISTYNIFVGPILYFALDDLGTEKLTEFSESILFEIIDSRLMNEINGMIITSNLSLDHLAERLGSDRIASRIAGLCRLFDLSGEKDGRILTHG